MQLSFMTPALHAMVLEPKPEDWPSLGALLDVKALVADLIAASNLLEVPVGVPDLDSIATENLDLVAGHSIVLECKVDHVPVRRRPDGRPDWEWIHRVQIVGWRRND